MHWRAAQLFTQARLRDEAIVSAGLAGILSFGPYVSLPAGDYEFSFDYVSDLAPSELAGSWDIWINSAVPHGLQLHKGSLNGTAKQKQTLRVDFSVSSELANKPIEFRSIFDGKGEMQVLALGLKRK
jgi:hypothetical protein